MARQITSENSYREKLVKVIPTEIIGAYVALQAVFTAYIDKISTIAFWGVLILLTVFTPLYLRKIYGVLDRKQIACSTGSFLVWAYSLGGPFQMVKLYDGRVAFGILVLWTLAIPFAIMRKTPICKGDWVTIISKKPSKPPKREFFVELNENMKEYYSQRAQVLSVDPDRKMARLDVDDKLHEWPFEWLILVAD